MSENSKPFQLTDEDLTNVFVSLAKIIGQVELISNGQYGELSENSDKFVHEIKRNACRTLAYWYQLMHNMANQKEEGLSHIAMFLHDSRSSSSFVSGYTHLMLEHFSDELNGEQRQALATIAKYWEQVEEYWQYLIKLWVYNK
jgi:signal transduction histidine kinase